MRRCWVLVGVITAAFAAYAGTPLASQYMSTTWDTTDGLPEETIYSVAQTPDGYLWLANANGLVRYDGAGFRVYQPRQDLGGNVKQEITRMGPGLDNTVWVYSKAYGLVRFRDGAFARAPPYPQPCAVEQILRDGDGTLIVCNERILRITGERVEEVTRFPRPQSRKIQAAVRDPEGHLWIGWIEGGLTRLDAEGSPETEYLPGKGLPAGTVNAIAPAGAGKLWVGTERGLALVGPEGIRHFTVADGLPDDHIRRLKLARDRTLWVGTAKGAAVQRQDRFERLFQLPAGWVTSISEDREDDVWIAFDEISLHRLRQPKFLNWGSLEGLLNERTQAVLEAAGAVWIVQSGRLWRLKNGRLERLPGISGKLQYLEADRDGRIWALGERTVYTIDPDTGRADPVPLPAETGQTLTLSPDPAGGIWIATTNGLLLATHGQIRAIPFEGLPPASVRADIRRSR